MSFLVFRGQEGFLGRSNPIELGFSIENSNLGPILGHFQFHNFHTLKVKLIQFLKNQSPNWRILDIYVKIIEGILLILSLIVVISVN